MGKSWLELLDCGWFLRWLRVYQDQGNPTADDLDESARQWEATSGQGRYVGDTSTSCSGSGESNASDQPEKTEKTRTKKTRTKKKNGRQRTAKAKGPDRESEQKEATPKSVRLKSARPKNATPKAEPKVTTTGDETIVTSKGRKTGRNSNEASTSTAGSTSGPADTDPCVADTSEKKPLLPVAPVLENKKNGTDKGSSGLSTEYGKRLNEILQITTTEDLLPKDKLVFEVVEGGATKNRSKSKEDRESIASGMVILDTGDNYQVCAVHYRAGIKGGATSNPVVLTIVPAKQKVSVSKKFKREPAFCLDNDRVRVKDLFCVVEPKGMISYYRVAGRDKKIMGCSESLQIGRHSYGVRVAESEDGNYRAATSQKEVVVLPGLDWWMEKLGYKGGGSCWTRKLPEKAHFTIPRRMQGQKIIEYTTSSKLMNALFPPNYQGFHLTLEKAVNRTEDQPRCYAQLLKKEYDCTGESNNEEKTRMRKEMGNELARIKKIIEEWFSENGL